MMHIAGETTELVRSKPHKLEHISANSVVVFDLDDVCLAHLPIKLALLLAHCRQFSHAEEHVASYISWTVHRWLDRYLERWFPPLVARGLRRWFQKAMTATVAHSVATSRTGQQVQADLFVLQREGLLCEKRELLGSSSGQHQRVAIKRLIIPTAGRPQALSRLLESVSRILERSPRDITVVVGDTSDLERAEANHDALECFRIATNAKVMQLDEAWAEATIARLSRSGCDPSVTQFALSGFPDVPMRHGANRNRLALMSGGHFALSCDDDVLLDVVRQTDSSRGLSNLAFTDFDPYMYRPINDAKYREIDGLDIFQIHENWLGRTVADLCVEHPGTLESLCDSALHDLLHKRGSVISTSNGFVGDSGMYSGASMLLSTNREMMAMLGRNSSLQEKLSKERRICKEASQPLLHHGECPTGMIFGRDYRSMPPPYFPVGRNEDGIQAAIALQCFPQQYAVSLPALVAHQPYGERHNDRYWIEALCSTRLSDVVIALIQRCASARGVTLRDVGLELSELCTVSQASWRSEVLHSLVESRARNFSRIMEHLRRFPANSDYRLRIEGGVNEAMSAKTLEQIIYLVDIGESVESELTRRIILSYSKLILAWPDLWGCMQELNSN